MPELDLQKIVEVNQQHEKDIKIPILNPNKLRPDPYSKEMVYVNPVH